MGIFSRRCDRIDPKTKGRCLGRIARLFPGKFCGTCGGNLAEYSAILPPSETALGSRIRWERPLGVFARRFDFTLSSANKDQELDIEIGTDVLLLEGGAVRTTSGSGTLRFTNKSGEKISTGGLFRSLLKVIKAPEQRYSIILVQSGSASCEASSQNLTSADGVDIGVELSFWYAIDSVDIFFRNLMKGAIEVREETVDEMISDMLAKEMSGFVQMNKCTTLRTDARLQDELMKAVNASLADACKLLGLAIVRPAKIKAIHSKMLDRLGSQQGALTERAGGVGLVDRSLELDRKEGQQDVEGAKIAADTREGMSEVDRKVRKLDAADEIDQMKTGDMVDRTRSDLDYENELTETEREKVRTIRKQGSQLDQQSHESNMEVRGVDHQIDLEGKVSEHSLRQRQREEEVGREGAMKDAKLNSDVKRITRDNEKDEHEQRLKQRAAELDLEERERARATARHRDQTEHAVKLQRESAAIEFERERLKSEADRTFELTKIQSIAGLPPDLAAQLMAATNPAALQVALAQLQAKNFDLQNSNSNAVELATLRSNAEMTQKLLEQQQQFTALIAQRSTEEASRNLEQTNKTLETMKEVAVAKARSAQVNINNRGDSKAPRSNENK